MSKKIMVVDDDPHICKAVKLILNSEGLTVVTAGNGLECLAKLKEEKPDLVLIDFFMPEMDGMQLCERIRKDNGLRSLKLAFLTIAPVEEIGERKLRKMGVIDYIRKPFDNANLVERVRKMID